jgi:hypothetical protein
MVSDYTDHKNPNFKLVRLVRRPLGTVLVNRALVLASCNRLLTAGSVLLEADLALAAENFDVVVLYCAILALRFVRG